MGWPENSRGWAGPGVLVCQAGLRLWPWIGVAGAAPRDGRQRLAHVLAGRTGRDLRWSLNAARTDLLSGVGCHLPITGLHASATRHVGEIVRRSTPDPFSPPRRCAGRAGHLLLGSGVLASLSHQGCDEGAKE